MKSKYDSETDALYLRFADAPVVESEEVRSGVVFDFGFIRLDEYRCCLTLHLGFEMGL